MATIRLKKDKQKERDDIRDKVKKLQSLRVDARKSPKDKSIPVKIADLEAEVNPVLAKSAWHDTLEVPDYRVDAYVGPDKPYEVFKDDQSSSQLDGFRQEAEKIAGSMLESQFTDLTTLPNETLILLYVLSGGKAKALTREDAVEHLSKLLDGVHFTE